MNKILKMTIEDYKNTVFTSGFLISIIIVLSYLSLWLIYKPNAFDIRSYQQETFKVLYIVIIYYSCKVLSKEFINGTYKTLFTGIYSRWQIIISKLIHFIALCMTFWLIVQILNPIIAIIDGEEYLISNFININMFNSLLIYILLGLIVGSFSLFITVITFNIFSTFTFSFMTIWCIYYFSPIIMNLNDKLGYSWSIIKNIPFYIIAEGLFKDNLNLFQILLLILWGGSFLIATLIIISLKDLKR